MTNPFFIQPVDLSQGLQGIGKLMAAKQDIDLKKQETAKKEQRLQAFQQAASQATTAADFAKLAGKFPEYSQAAGLMIDHQSKQLGMDRDLVTDLYKKAALSPNPVDVFVDWIAENPESHLKEGLVSDIGWALSAPDQFRDYTQKMWASADPDGFKAAMGGKATDLYSDIKQTEDGKLIGYNKQTGRYDLLPMPADVRVGKPPSTTINVGQGQTEYQKAVSKGMAERYLAIQNQSSLARSQLSTLNQLERLSDDAISGSMKEAKKSLLRVADTIGLDAEGLAETEVFEALSSRLTLDKAQALPGALSDKDIDFLQSTVPTLSQSKEGRKKLIGVMRDMAQLEIDYAKAASEYMRDRKGQVFDENEFAEWYAQNKRGNKDSLSKYYQSESNGKDKAIPNITTQAEFDALPSGARFYEDGRLLIKD